MNLMNRYHVYPPNFTITVSGHQATGRDHVKFVFKGAVQDNLHYEIPLILPRKTTSECFGNSMYVFQQGFMVIS